LDLKGIFIAEEKSRRKESVAFGVYIDGERGDKMVQFEYFRFLVGNIQKSFKA